MPRGKRGRRSDRLLRVLRDYERIVVITHDTPDPDAIASGWALLTLVREKLRKHARLVGGGAIVRAENVHMMKLLHPPLELIDEYHPAPGTAGVLIDCSPEGANQLCGGSEERPVAAIDHHKPHRPLLRIRFRDMRPKASASAVIVTGYLREQGVEPSKELATALLYAVRTEVIGTPVRFTRSERGVLAWLSERADHQILQQIQNAPLSRRYFEDLMLAMASTFLYGDVAVCLIPGAGSAEIVGEVADLLVRYEDVERVLCGAVVEESLVVSARTSASGGNAVNLLGGALRGLGHWGGHPNRAGGKVLPIAGQKALSQNLVEEVKTRWLASCGVEGLRGVRLVARRDILEVL